MFICLECHKPFCEPYETKDEITGYTESVSSCCNGEYEKAYQCEECQEWFEEDDIFTHKGYSMCEQCIKNYFTFELGEEYISDKKEEAEFYIECVYDCQIWLCKDKLLDLCKMTFDELAELYPEKALKEIQDYCFEDFGDYAEWYLKEISFNFTQSAPENYSFESGV